MQLLDYLKDLATFFARAFTRMASFKWFFAILIAILLRTDKLGVTSFVRSLNADPRAYERMLAFYRSDSWSPQIISDCWIDFVSSQCSFFVVNGRPLLIGDGILRTKEGRRMPGVKKLTKGDSDTQSKPSKFHGLSWGCQCILAGPADDLVGIPLTSHIDEGLRPTYAWKKDERDQSKGEWLNRHRLSDKPPEASPAVLGITDACLTAQRLQRDCYSINDRLYPTIPVLRELIAQNAANEYNVYLISMAKSNAVAYELPPEKSPGPGRPPLKGKKVKLRELFDDTGAFTEADAVLYGKNEKIRYLCKDLLWGEGLYHLLRFVLVIREDGSRCILLTTDVKMKPVDIIEAYARRFKIEHMFKESTQDMCAFGSHFWSKSMPKLNRYAKSGTPSPLESVDSSRDRKNILKTIRATEMFAQMELMALGLLHIMAMDLEPGNQMYQRTKKKGRPSVKNTLFHVKQNITGFALQAMGSPIPDLIPHLKNVFKNVGTCEGPKNLTQL